jgi:circadian clock protein KaiC
MSTTLKTEDTTLSTTGAAGLDDILGGGLTPQRLYLLEGNPGSGKTTLAVQYLLEGVRLGERSMYIALSESKAELLAAARSHGWSLDGIDIVELAASEQELDPENQYTMFQPAELELNNTTKTILAEIDRTKPKRVVIDSLSELRLLAQLPLRYRRQVLALKQFFAGRECTVLLLDDKTSDPSDLQLQSIAHGVLALEQLSPEYGGTRRRLRIAKLRGQQFRSGYHDFVIKTGGISVFPRLVAAEHSTHREISRLRGEIPELDALLGGGIDVGTSVLLVGPAGSGKSSVAVNYAYAAAKRGERSALLIFDERVETLLTRVKGLGMDLAPYLESGLITIRPVDPAELSPGELSEAVRQAVDGTDGHPPAKIVVIDSLNGYMHAMTEEHFLIAQLHELLTYLGHKGVSTFLVLAQHGLVGTMQSPIDTTYLADTVILFRYFEAAGQVRQALSVVKRRCGKHERTIRELRLDGKIEVGEPLSEFQGVLTGVPTFRGNGRELLGPNYHE